MSNLQGERRTSVTTVSVNTKCTLCVVSKSVCVPVLLLLHFVYCLPLKLNLIKKHSVYMRGRNVPLHHSVHHCVRFRTNNYLAVFKVGNLNEATQEPAIILTN